MNVDPWVQAIGIVICWPENESPPSEQEPTPAATDVFAPDGEVHPDGTTTVTSEPLRNVLDGAVKVRTNWFVVDEAVAVVGATIIVPSPSVAVGEITIADAGAMSGGLSDVLTANVDGP